MVSTRCGRSLFVAQNELLQGPREVRPSPSATPGRRTTRYAVGLCGDEWPRLLLLVDESHVTLPQLCNMYAGDRARKRQLIKHGYRLPSTLDNRPLQDVEFWDCSQQTVFVSVVKNWSWLGIHA